MKKIITVLVIVAISSSAVITNANAQVDNKKYLISADKINSYLAYEKRADASESKVSSITVDENVIKDVSTGLVTSKAELKVLKANNRAAASFKKEFKNATDVKIAFERNLIVGRYTKDDIKTYVIYNKNGRWINTLKYSDENKMPKEIKKIVKQTYPGYDVTLCAEIYESNMIFHVVQIEDKTTFKQLGLYDGEITVIQQFTKTNP